MTDAKALTHELGGKWHRRYGTAPCPVCQPERRKGQTALTLSDGTGGRLLAHCKRAGCAFTDILAAAGIGAGEYRPPDPAELVRRETERQAEAAKKARQAQRCWNEAQPIAGTVAAYYLRDRMITCDLPDTLRFHPDCWHGATATRHPALVALVEGGDSFALHRTFLKQDGSGKAAIEPNKAMLGSVAGGAVRLSQGPSRLLVGEGIESTLSLLCGLLEGPVTASAALSTSGLRGLRLPQVSGRLTIAQDGDPAGRAAAHELAQRAHRTGWAVSILDPGDGADFNDILARKAVQV